MSNGAKRVLVTGASRGIGRAIATRLSADGWQVAIHANRELELANALADEINAAGVYQADLAEPDGAARLMDSCLADGPIQALVNNAGIYVPGGFMAADFEGVYRRIIAVNLDAPVQLMRRAAQHFEGVGGGKILNIASRVGFKGEANAAAYAASKAALISFTRSLAVELAPQRIGVFAIAPGWVDTAMARDGMDSRLPEILSSLPLGRMATPADCAGAASYLLGDDASYLSGIAIDINGASYFH